MSVAGTELVSAWAIEAPLRTCQWRRERGTKRPKTTNTTNGGGRRRQRQRRRDSSSVSLQPKPPPVAVIDSYCNTFRIVACVLSGNSDCEDTMILTKSTRTVISPFPPGLKIVERNRLTCIDCLAHPTVASVVHIFVILLTKSTEHPAPIRPVTQRICRPRRLHDWLAGSVYCNINTSLQYCCCGLQWCSSTLRVQ